MRYNVTLSLHLLPWRGIADGLTSKSHLFARVLCLVEVKLWCFFGFLHRVYF